MSQKRLIFTVTPGRSGTMYLAHLLSGLPDVWAQHEPAPYFQSTLPMARRDPAIAKRFLEEVKLPFIRSLPESIYIETSHYPAKGYIEPMLELGVVPDLILFSRDARKVASSFFLIGVAKKRDKSDEYKTHMMGPDEANFLPARNWQGWNEYQLYYWYVLETQARGRHYAQLVKAKGGKAFETSLEKLKSGQDYRQLLAWVGVPENVAQARVADKEFQQRILNDKSDSKRRKGREAELAALDLDVLEAQVKKDCGLTEEGLRGAVSVC